VVASLGGLAGASSASAALLGLPTSYPGGTSASSVAIRDLSGEGRPDVAVTDSGSGSVSIRLGTGGGALGPPTTYATGAGPASVAIGDLDGDGRRDLVVADSGSGTVSVRMGTGAGALGPRAAYPAGAGPVSVAIADLDGDGLGDVVAADSDQAAVSVLLGTGDGHLAARHSYSVPGVPRSVTIADLDGDDAPDLALGLNPPEALDGNLAILLGTGTGGFEPSTAYGGLPALLATTVTGAAVGDLDEDGVPDAVVVGAEWNEQFSVLMGTGRGAFGPPRNAWLRGNGYAVALVDLDRDGHLDLVAVTDAGVQVRRGRGDGRFRDPVTYPAGRTPVSMALHDLDGDGRLDTVVGDRGGGLAVLLNGRAGEAILQHYYLCCGDGAVGRDTETSAGLTNTGTEPLVMSSFALRGTDRAEFSLDPGTCARIEPATTCTFTIGFHPVTTGVKDVWLEAVSNATGSPHHLEIYARGVLDAPGLALERKLAFKSQQVGTVSAYYNNLVIVHSVGMQPLHVSSITTTDPAQFGIYADTCSGQAVAPGGRCYFRGRFAPTSVGSQSARAVIASDADGAPHSMPMTGTGLSAPWPVFTGDTGFGPQPVGTAATRLVRVTNRGSEPLIVSPLRLTGLNPGQFGLLDNTCATVPAGGSCIFRVRFAPTGLGAKSARVIIPDNAPGSPHEVRVTGTGT
jgi:hypothetical protein